MTMEFRGTKKLRIGQRVKGEDICGDSYSGVVVHSIPGVAGIRRDDAVTGAYGRTRFTDEIPRPIQDQRLWQVWEKEDGGWGWDCCNGTLAIADHSLPWEP